MKRLVLGLFVSTVMFGQEFEVASVRTSTSDGIINSRLPSLDVEPGRNINFTNMSIRELIMLSYGVGVSQISGPDWLTDPFNTPRFDIIAKVPEDGKKEQVPAMLRSLLANRFKLQMHRDQKTVQIYALELGKKPPKLQATAEGDTGASGCTKSLVAGKEMTISAVCHRMSSATWAQQLQTLAPLYFGDLPIVDLTGLKGSYDFNLEWVPTTVADSGGGPSMFEAVEQQLGLKLEKQKQSMELLVVDHCEKNPTEN